MRGYVGGEGGKGEAVGGENYGEGFGARGVRGRVRGARAGYRGGGGVGCGGCAE